MISFQFAFKTVSRQVEKNAKKGAIVMEMGESTGTYSRGMVVYTVTSPATAPMAKVILEGMVCPGRAFPCTNCFNVVYVVKRTAEFAPCLII